MIDDIQTSEKMKPGTSRWRRVSAAAGVAALATAGTILVASPASATVGNCGYYHNWKECISYSSGSLTAVAYNGYSVAETEQIWESADGHRWTTPPITIQPGDGAGLTEPASGPSQACAGIDSVQIVCVNI